SAVAAPGESSAGSTATSAARIAGRMPQEIDHARVTTGLLSCGFWLEAGEVEIAALDLVGRTAVRRGDPHQGRPDRDRAAVGRRIDRQQVGAGLEMQQLH